MVSRIVFAKICSRMLMSPPSPPPLSFFYLFFFIPESGEAASPSLSPVSAYVTAEITPDGSVERARPTGRRHKWRGWTGQRGWMCGGSTRKT